MGGSISQSSRLRCQEQEPGMAAVIAVQCNIRKVVDLLCLRVGERSIKFIYSRIVHFSSRFSSDGMLCLASSAEDHDILSPALLRWASATSACPEDTERTKRE